MSTEEARTFRFRYTLYMVDARLDDHQIVVKTGIRTVAAPFAGLRQLYVVRAPGRDDVELLLGYVDARGRQRRLRAFADRDQPGFDQLVEAILARRPEIDIRHLSVSEAYRRTGSKEMEGVALPVVMLLGVLVVAVLFGPMLVHGFDRGHAEVTLAQLIAGDLPDTRNLVVTEARAAIDEAVQAQAGADAKLQTVTAYIPLVSPERVPGELVRVVLEVRGLKAAAFDELAGVRRFPGVLRDVWWEGLAQRTRKAFDERGVALADEVRLVQYRADGRQDLALAGGVLGLMLLLIAGVWWVLRKRGPRRPRRPWRPPGVEVR